MNLSNEDKRKLIRYANRKKELERSKKSQIDSNIYSNNILPSKNEYKEHNIYNKMHLNYKVRRKENKIVLYKNLSAQDRGSVVFNLYETFRDVITVKLIKAKIFTESDTDEHSEFFVLHIEELNKNISDTENHKLNNSFAILDIDSHFEHSNAIHHHKYTNSYDINRDVKYFDPPLNSLSKLTCQIYKEDQNNILNDTSDNSTSIPINLRLEFIIETKENTRIY